MLQFLGATSCLNKNDAKSWDNTSFLIPKDETIQMWSHTMTTKKAVLHKSNIAEIQYDNNYNSVPAKDE